MGYLVIFGFIRFHPKWVFIFVLFFVFLPKMSFALGQKCYICYWTVIKFCDIGTGDFRCRFSTKNGIPFSSAFSFMAENEKCIFGRPCLYIKVFQFTPYVNDFKTLNNPGSGQPVRALKISFTPSIFDTHLSSFIIIIVVVVVVA